MRPNTFAGAEIDRAAERRRDPDWVAARFSGPEGVAVVTTPDGVYLVRGEPARPLLVPTEGLDPEGAVFLGTSDGRALFALDAERLPEEPDGARIDVRAAGALLSQADGGLVAYAAALTTWHRRNRFCAVCGTGTNVAEGGHLRKCPNCGAEHHPRTDPVVIVLVTDGDRALLGRQARWPPGRYSALAGFVEPGESLEEAVAREVREETGIEVDDVTYRSSQPWPFPASLMLGFAARHRAGEPAVADQELEHVRWFDRAEVEAAVEGRSEIHVPPPLAIARRLIDEWLAR